MSSLVGSIFGDKGNHASLSSIFDSSSALPDRPQHRAPPRKPREEKATAADEGKKKKRKRKDNEEEEEKKQVDETKEGDDNKEEQSKTIEESKDAEERTIFVGNLPLDTTRKSLASLFSSKVGKVESARLRSVASTGVKVAPNQKGNQNLVKKVCANTNKVDDNIKSCAQGYVVFEDRESVDKALELNNFELQGRRLRVDRAKPTVDASRSVFIGNLPYHADEASLRQHVERLCSLGVTEIENVRLVRDKETQQCKGFGYVLFANKTLVTTALQRVHESTYLKRVLRVSVCGKRYKGRQGIPTDAQERRKRPKKTDVGALQRIISKEASGKKRKRGETNIKGANGNNPNGLSRRQASEAKLEKRHKKLQKRAVKGMGKTKQRS